MTLVFHSLFPSPAASSHTLVAVPRGGFFHISLARLFGDSVAWRAEGAKGTGSEALGYRLALALALPLWLLIGSFPLVNTNFSAWQIGEITRSRAYSEDYTPLQAVSTQG